jgi:ribosomal protein S27AE
MDVEAPFTDDEVASLNAYQKSNLGHPYTCECGDHVILIATTDGWVCSRCAYTQTWCHDFTANWDWTRLKNHASGGYSNATAGKFDY